MLGDMGRAVASKLELDVTLKLIVVAAVEMSGGDQGTIYDYDEAGEHFMPRMMHGMSDAHMDMLRATAIRLGDADVGPAAASGKPRDVSDGLRRSLSRPTAVVAT